MKKINENELRPGVAVCDPIGMPILVRGFADGMINPWTDDDEAGGAPIDECEPIKITPATLNACEFIAAPKGDPYGGWLSPEDSLGNRIRVTIDESGRCWFSNHNNPIELVGMHILQNLFFALTQKELEYTP